MQNKRTVYCKTCLSLKPKGEICQPFEQEFDWWAFTHPSPLHFYFVFQVTCAGQVIGGIVAETQAQAQRAAKMVKVTYEELPRIITIEVNLKKVHFLMVCTFSFVKGDEMASGKFARLWIDWWPVFKPYYCLVLLDKTSSAINEYWRTVNEPERNACGAGEGGVGYLRWASIPSRWSCNAPSRFMLQKPRYI